MPRDAGQFDVRLNVGKCTSHVAKFTSFLSVGNLYPYWISRVNADKLMSAWMSVSLDLTWLNLHPSWVWVIYILTECRSTQGRKMCSDTRPNVSKFTSRLNVGKFTSRLNVGTFTSHLSVSRFTLSLNVGNGTSRPNVSYSHSGMIWICSHSGLDVHLHSGGI